MHSVTETVRRKGREGFTRLPPRVRRTALGLIGKRAPWDPRFDRRPPEAGPGMVVGPPDFVGVGVQKAGTTWWFSMIDSHPDVFTYRGLHKERRFFNWFYEGFTADDISAYHRWFPRPPGSITGEWTPDYCHHYWIPPLLARSAPDTKILFMVRDPVDRYRSGLSHHLGVGTKLTPGLVSDAFHRGFYFQQFSRIERFFGAERVLLLQFEACVAAPFTHLQTTFEFLGLEPFTPMMTRTDQAHSTKRYSMPPGMREQLIELYAPDVMALAARHPDLDLELWPNFARGR
jgi:hypothetical protein